MIVDPEREDYRNIYRLMVGAIVPRPIAFVSTMSADGRLNLAPFSFFTAISANPPVICFCPMVRGDSSYKDTLNNIRVTDEFVVNVVSEDFASRMNVCSGEYPAGVDEFEKSGLTPVASDLVKPPRVLESRVNMECRLLRIVDVSAKPLGGSIVLGEVIRFHVSDEIFDNFKIDPDKLKPIGRMGGPTYTRTTDRFDMERPKV
ncbi:MAG: flavin reductase family protein [Acidobacteriota bacterium]|nr:flavin reductase family protein [Acidobacteriota bacterium]